MEKKNGRAFLEKKMSFTQSKFDEILINCEALKIREHSVFNFFFSGIWVETLCEFFYVVMCMKIGVVHTPEKRICVANLPVIGCLRGQ